MMINQLQKWFARCESNTTGTSGTMNPNKVGTRNSVSRRNKCLANKLAGIAWLKTVSEIRGQNQKLLNAINTLIQLHNTTDMFNG